MSTNTEIQYTEKRLMLRIPLRLPFIISGSSANGKEIWSEPTETENISTGGALFYLSQEVNVGEKLYIRSHHPDGLPIKIQGRVLRSAAAKDNLVGVAVRIEKQTEDWIRFFVAWVADGHPDSERYLFRR